MDIGDIDCEWCTTYTTLDYIIMIWYLWLWNGNIGILVGWKYGYIGIFWNYAKVNYRLIDNMLKSWD